MYFLYVFSNNIYSSTYQKSYDKFLKKFEESIKDRNDYVERLNSLSENIKASVVKKEEIRKKVLLLIFSSILS